MLPRFALLLVLSAFLLIPTSADTKAVHQDELTRIDWASDATCQLVFQAVLEGLYADGVSNEIVDRVLGVDPQAKQGRFDTHFVYCCPLCHPAYEAFQLYRGRSHFYGRKDSRDTFGPGLEPVLRRKLMSERITERLEALHTLIQRWVTLRLDSMRLLPKEKEEWAQRLAQRRKAGMISMEKANFAGKAAGYKGCAICDGSADALPFK